MGIRIVPKREKKVKDSVASLKSIRKKTIDAKKEKTGGRTKSNQDMSNAQLLKELKNIFKDAKMASGGKVSKKVSRKK